MQLICAGDAELNRIVIKGLKDYASLGETEKPQFIETFMAFVSFSQNAFYQWQEKALSPPLWVCWESLVMNLLSSLGGKELWKELAVFFTYQTITRRKISSEFHSKE